MLADVPKVMLKTIVFQLVDGPSYIFKKLQSKVCALILLSYLISLSFSLVSFFSLFLFSFSLYLSSLLFISLFLFSSMSLTPTVVCWFFPLPIPTLDDNISLSSLSFSSLFICIPSFLSLSIFSFCVSQVFQSLEENLFASFRDSEEARDVVMDMYLYGTGTAGTDNDGVNNTTREEERVGDTTYDARDAMLWEAERYSHSLCPFIFSYNLFSCNLFSCNLFTYNLFSYNLFSYNLFS